MTADRLFRVDPRLVHATLMNRWVPATGARTLLIGDGALARDEKKRAILEMSAMGLVDVRFYDESELAGPLAECDSELMVIVMFSTIEGVERARKAGLSIDRVNIGHIPEGEGRREIHPAVHLGPADFEVIDRLQAMDIEVYIQPLPSDRATVIPRTSSKPPPQRSAAAKLQTKLRVVNDRGLHLRAAHILAQLVTTLPCAVTIGHEGNHVNAKSLLGLTTLGATCGTMLVVDVEGPDAANALDQIRTLFASGFEEGRHWVGDGAEEESV